MPVIIIFFLILYWDQLNEKIYKRFKNKIDYILVTIVLIILGTVLALLYF